MSKDTEIKKISFLAKIRNYFLAGIVVLIPIGITIYFSIFVERAFSNLLPKYLNPNNFLPFDIPGLEILITFCIITFIGMLSVVAFSFVLSYLAFIAIKTTVGLRISKEAEKLGTDKAEVGVTAYSIRD